MKKCLAFILATFMILSTAIFTVSATEDIPGTSKQFSATMAKVTAKSGNIQDVSTGINIWSNNAYAEFTVNTETSAEYYVSVIGAVSVDESSLSVSVNGTPYISKLPVYKADFKNKILGTITLSPGANKIRFKNESNKGEWGNAITMYAFTLTRVSEDITSDPMTFALNTSTINTSGSKVEANSDASLVVLSRGGYAELIVNTKTAGSYFMTLKAGTVVEGCAVSVSVGGTTQIESAPLANTGGYYKYVDHDMGIISLQQGVNKIKITSDSTTTTEWLITTAFTLKALTEDITENPKAFPLNTTTINTANSKVESNSSTSYVVLSRGGYAEYTVCTLQEGTYAFVLSIGTDGAGVCAGVSVNGTTQIESAEIAETGGYARVDHVLGTVTLAAGINKIKISSVSTTTTIWCIVDEFSLMKTDNMKTISADQATRLEIEDYATENVKEHTAASGGEWVSNTWTDKVSPIYIAADVQQDGYYDLDYVMLASSDYLSVVTVYIDGKAVGNNSGTYIENLNSPDGFNFDYGSVCKYRKNLVWLSEGLHIIKIDVAKTKGDSVYKYQTDYLEFTPCTGIDIQELEIVTEDGARLPYEITDGTKAYAKAEILKLSETDDNVRLLIAQYSDQNELVQANDEVLDISGMAVNEKKAFFVPLTFRGTGGTVKAFLWDSVTLAPLMEEVSYSEPDFFDESVLDETAVYTDATNVLDMNGTPYADYSIHDENYDIDAIFYDSHVGEQTKVFAYIGVPKGATEENPVPAVVCVHGGGGYAFSEWVKHWNDRGYAAIAMSLTGDGPDKVAPEVMYTTHPHPYKGVYCWGNSAFLADYQNAGMYQNVLNVIRAHNVLRSYPGVDESKTGIIGVSWGGVTTTTVIGVDNRFKFAIPVYGAGYLDESETNFSATITASGNTVAWDPGNFAAQSTVPTLYMNGDSDTYFSISSTTKTKRVTENAKLSIRHKWTHGHTPVYNLEQVYDYADAMTQGYDPFITISDEKVEGNVLTAKIACPEGVSVESVTLYYIEASELAYAGKINWLTTSKFEMTEDGISVNVPGVATYCYAAVTDNNGNIISTEYLPVK